MTPQHQFEVVARAYYKLKEMGVKPTIQLLPIGRDVFGLDYNQLHNIQLRARYFVKGIGVPTSCDDKDSVWPSKREQEAA